MHAARTAANGLAGLEEYAISGDAWTDPLELRVDRLGAELGSRLGR